MDFEQKAREFLAAAPQFRLGDLVTEQAHPLTAALSSLSQSDIPEAITMLHQIDASALDCLGAVSARISAMARRIAETLETGHSIFVCGCGATGRLSLVCETLWRAEHRTDGLHNRVFAFMAGGDAALVRSAENFEDHPEYGARQLEESGFLEGDLCIGVTEGGETPFVIGATLRAAALSSNRPFFLYCNPDDILCRVAERSAEVIRDPRIEKINCTVGPMALAGSTRMQASTVLMAAVGSALEYHTNPDGIRRSLRSLRQTWEEIDPQFLKEFIVAESSLYRKGDYLLYATDRDLAITVLTDTTERAPTFSMHPFESVQDDDGPFSLSYVYLPDAADESAAWEQIFGRPPRVLRWTAAAGAKTGLQPKSYDFSETLPARRRSACTQGAHHDFVIKKSRGGIDFELENSSYRLPVKDLSALHLHCVLKMLLNIHSTLVMGRLGRYDGNVMTWVRPSNNKLIDRAIRYASLLLKRRNIDASYEQIALACFKVMENLPADRSLVHAVVEEMGGNGRQPD